jgi:hypothetical protein
MATRLAANQSMRFERRHRPGYGAFGGDSQMRLNLSKRRRLTAEINMLGDKPVYLAIKPRHRFEFLNLRHPSNSSQ